MEHGLTLFGKNRALHSPVPSVGLHTLVSYTSLYIPQLYVEFNSHPGLNYKIGCGPSSNYQISANQIPRQLGQWFREAVQTRFCG